MQTTAATLFAQQIDVMAIYLRANINHWNAFRFLLRKLNSGSIDDLMNYNCEFVHEVPDVHT